jgi:murein DD-endopeptidase MepM/ murein hydrolase activator NlpD
MKSLSRQMARRLPLLVLLGLILQSCQPARLAPAPSASAPPAATPSLEPPPGSAPPAQVTPEATVWSPASPTEIILPADLPTPVSDPLVFVFPTAGAEPVTLWRPPLYETPWEPTPYDHFYFARSIGADKVNWPLARYRYGGVFFENTVHTGIDIPSPTGTPILAAGSGQVIWAGYGLFYQKDTKSDPYGIAVAIKHDFGWQDQELYTIYGHMDKTYAWVGQTVQTGDLIGEVGETGKTTGPHLHFEVRVGENMYARSRNPELWIAPPQGWGVAVGRIFDSYGGLLKRQKVNFFNQETGQTWYVFTYGGGSLNPDPYYQENMVLGDLPAGSYSVSTDFDGKIIKEKIEILPGMVTFIQFNGARGFKAGPPPEPYSSYDLPEVYATATPTLTITTTLTAP